MLVVVIAIADRSIEMCTIFHGELLVIFAAGQHDVVPHPFDAFHPASGYRESEPMARRRGNVEGNWKHTHRPGSNTCGRGLIFQVHAVAKGD